MAKTEAETEAEIGAACRAGLPLQLSVARVRVGYRLIFALAAVLPALLLTSMLVTGSAAAQSDWLSRFELPTIGTRQTSTQTAADKLTSAIAYLKTRPGLKDGAVELVAQSTGNGSWTLAHRTGEIFTSANATELARGLELLTGVKPMPLRQLSLILTEDSLFAGRNGFNDLPKDATLYVLFGNQSRRLMMGVPTPSVDTKNEKLTNWVIELRPGLLVNANDPYLFSEVLEQMARPVLRSSIRLLGLQTGGAATLSSMPRFDTNGARVRVDYFDPSHMGTALKSLAGQTAFLVGRIDGDQFYFQPANGPERSVPLRQIETASEAADVDLYVLRSSSSGQLGNRNWLWQETEVKGLDDALKSATLADIFATIRGQQTLVVTARRLGSSRIALAFDPMTAPTTAVSAIVPTIVPSVAMITGKLGALVGSVTGQVDIQSIFGYVRTSERQSELNRRLLPGIPSGLQFIYALSLLCGLIGLGVSRRWWARIWPAEMRADYSNQIGYWAARGVRAALFALVFLPLTGYAAIAALGYGALRALGSRRIG
jgi:hypothetical protein